VAASKGAIAMGGVFTTAQARAAGYSKADIRRLLRNGRWVALREGAYVRRAELEAADDRRAHALRVAALLAVLDCDAVACGMSAARIWGLDVLGSWPAELAVATSAPVAYKRRDGYVLRPTLLPGHHRAQRYGVAVTSVERTVVDVARTAPSLRSAVVVTDSALRERLTTVDRLREAVAESRGTVGVRQAVEAVRLADPASESVLESVSRVGMHLQGLPPPRTQVVIGAARVDFLWEEFGVVGEADGLGKYTGDRWRTTADVVRAEKRREERLFDLGYEVVRWGWEEAMAEAILARRLRAAFERGAARKRGHARRAA
jgi:very-short-patch-repair endonuclease